MFFVVLFSSKDVLIILFSYSNLFRLTASGKFKDQLCVECVVFFTFSFSVVFFLELFYFFLRVK